MSDYTEQDAKRYLSAANLKHFMTGSRVICSPPVLNTDADFVVLDNKGINWEGLGFKMNSHPEEYEGADDVTMYRRGEVNLIVTHEPAVFVRWKVATAAATQMNILDKKQRIALFQGVLYGNW